MHANLSTPRVFAHPASLRAGLCREGDACDGNLIVGVWRTLHSCVSGTENEA
jgi:hypothetical protein